MTDQNQNDKMPEPPRNPIPRLDSRLKAAMDAATQEVNDVYSHNQAHIQTPQRSNEPPEHRFMVVNDRLCDLILETARSQLNKAENNLKRAEQEVNAIRERSKQMWDALEGFHRELEDYAHASMEVHERFVKKNSK